MAGALQKAGGAFIKTSGEKRNFEASADIADLNARMSDLAAKSTLRQGQLEEQKSKIETTRTKDKAATGFAGNNIALDSQTAIRVMTSTEVLGDIEANIINANAGRAAWGYRMEGVQFRNEARTTRATAANLSPGRSAFNSLLGSAGNITESFVKLKKAGAFEKKSIGKTGRGTGKR